MLRIDTRHLNDVLVLDVKGRIASGAPEATFADVVRSALQNGDRQIVVNLENARSADASGVSTLAGARLQARNAGGELKLVNIGGFAELLTLTALYMGFDVYDCEEELVVSVATGHVAPTVGHEPVAA